MSAGIAGGFGLYVHWPFCKSKCPYCDFNSHVRERIDQARWAEALVRELTTIASSLELRPRLESVFFGGGTPSLMAPETVGKLLETAAKLFPTAEDLEVTLEANPTSSEAAAFTAFRGAGVNRLSLGVQSLDDAVLAFLGRKHSAKEAVAALDFARRTFPRVSFDLIYARPGQTPQEWRAELEAALAIAADHLSLYQLTIEPATKFAALVDADILKPLPDETAAELFDLTQEVTEAAGLPAYEISNHAAPGAESRHNLVYWRGGAWLGIGPGAHGRLPAPGGARIATETQRVPEQWLALVESKGDGVTLREAVAPRDQAEEILLMGLRLREGADLARLQRLAPDLINEDALAGLAAQGFVMLANGRVKATPKGRLVLNRLIADAVEPGPKAQSA